MSLITICRSWFTTASLLALCVPAVACGPAAQSTRIPPAPVVGYWADPSFMPERQCRGRYALEDLEPYLSRARLALWLPGTRAVALDSSRRCIAITVESVGGGRLAELVLRGVAVPRRAVLLILVGSERRG
jgi:hypothetical protein